MQPQSVSDMAFMHTAGVTQQNMQTLAEMFAQAMQLIVMATQQSDALIVQSMGALVGTISDSQQRMVSMMAHINERADARMETLAGHFTQGQSEMMKAMSRKRRVKRGADGRVEGVE